MKMLKFRLPSVPFVATVIALLALALGVFTELNIMKIVQSKIALSLIRGLGFLCMVAAFAVAFVILIKPDALKSHATRKPYDRFLIYTLLGLIVILVAGQVARSTGFIELDDETWKLFRLGTFAIIVFTLLVNMWDMREKK